MAHSPLPASGPETETEEAFLADRQRFWFAWTSFVFWAATFIIILLILLAYFLT